MKNFGEIIKQAQKVGAKMSQVQEELAKLTVTVTSGGGMVTVTANGQKEITEIKIEPEIIKADEKEMLEDLIQAAVNEALSRVNEMTNEEMKKITGGLNIPGLGGLF
ncbi:YbaB/EbfC family nucleoid-associated protein [bacterium]|nr:YbaB/EbfC family nucleoid-associated protein [bacterium]MBU0900165.1 YbaB/EbfC family nucleoid-associated protein [bacterium]MBU1153048.1 YbaB/EbfC family nucleoid-associated protein [bacterium]MBU2599122.1 YbaB/EbfC family nucleoid-associated protein [bacterium]